MKESKTKDQQAQEYVLNRQTARHNAKTEEEATMADFDKTRKVWDAYDMEQAYSDGYTACEQSMWRSVEEELPEIPNGKKMIRVLAWIGDEPLVCWYTCHGRFITTLAAKERYSYDCMAKVKVHLSSEREDVTEIVTHWMPIPTIPDSNTEKK